MAFLGGEHGRGDLSTTPNTSRSVQSPVSTTLNTSNKSNQANYFNQIMPSGAMSVSPTSSSFNQSFLLVNVKELNLKLYNEIVVSWNILEDTSVLDFIGVYRTGKSSFIDSAFSVKIKFQVGLSVRR